MPTEPGTTPGFGYVLNIIPRITPQILPKKALI
jgi:hypothetical protein